MASASFVADLTIKFLVIQVELGQFAFENSHPAINHNLAVVERAHFLLTLLHLTAAVLNFARRTILEQRLGR